MVDDRKDIERGRIAQDILDNEIFQDPGTFQDLGMF